MTRASSRLLLVVAFTSLLVAPAIAGATAAPTDRGGEGEVVPAPAVDESEVRFQQSTPTNSTNSTNSTAIVHTDPDSVDDGSDYSDIQRWLSGRIESALVNCAREAESGEAGTCTALSEQFPSLAGRYAVLAEETDDSTDDRTARLLNQTADRQQRFVAAVEEYRSVLEAYRQARRQNDEQRAAALAKQVSRRGSQVVTVGGQLSDNYESIGPNGSLTVSSATTITTEVTANVSETTERIRTTEFEPPEITVSSTESRASFAEPVGIGGRLRTENGTPLGNRTVAVRTPEGRTLTRTDGDGRFEVTYRPTTASAGNATIVAKYLPENGSGYVTTQDRVNVSVVATEGTLRLNEAPSTLSFGDRLRVYGVFRVNDTGIGNIPISVTLGGVQFGTTQTNESGYFSLSEPVPASVPNGSRTLSVSLTDENGAITAESVSRDVKVNETTPGMVVRTNRLDANTAHISGRIAAGGSRVSSGEILIRESNRTIATITADSEGTFGTNVSLANVSPSETTFLSVGYRPPDGNLEPINARLQVSAVSQSLLPPLDLSYLSGLLGPVGVDSFVLAAGAIAVLVFLVAKSGVASDMGAFLLSFVDRDQTDGESAFDSDDDRPAYMSELDLDDDEMDVDTGGDEEDRGKALLEVAEAQFEGERTDEAVVAAYIAARQRLESQSDLDSTLTHWEFLSVYRDSLDGDYGKSLEQLTRAYERAAFSSSESTSGTVREAISNAGFLVRRNTISGSESSASD